MADVLTTLINESRTPQEFCESARLVQAHLLSGRKPEESAALVAHLAYKGHVIIAQVASRHEYALDVSRAVVDTMGCLGDNGEND